MSKVLAAGLLLAGVALAADRLGPAREHVAAGRYDEARRELEPRLGDSELEAEALVLLTTACNAQGDYEHGIDYGKRAVLLLPESGEAHFRYAVALRTKMAGVNKLRALPLLDDYKQELARALELDPAHVGAREEEIAFLTEAPGFAGGSLPRARERIEELKPLDWRRAMMLQAAVERKEGRPEAAAQTYRAVLARHPTDAQARKALEALR